MQNLAHFSKHLKKKKKCKRELDFTMYRYSAYKGTGKCIPTALIYFMKIKKKKINYSE